MHDPEGRLLPRAYKNNMPLHFSCLFVITYICGRTGLIPACIRTSYLAAEVCGRGQAENIYDNNPTIFQGQTGLGHLPWNDFTVVQLMGLVFLETHFVKLAHKQGGNFLGDISVSLEQTGTVDQILFNLLVAFLICDAIYKKSVGEVSQFRFF